MKFKKLMIFAKKYILIINYLKKRHIIIIKIILMIMKHQKVTKFINL